MSSSGPPIPSPVARQATTTAWVRKDWGEAKIGGGEGSLACCLQMDWGMREGALLCAMLRLCSQGARHVCGSVLA